MLVDDESADREAVCVGEEDADDENVDVGENVS